MALAPRVSVIIPAYNAAGSIERALRSAAGDVECIVVDDGSTDGTAEIVAAMPDVTLIRQANAGPAAARNAGARCARAPVLVFLDSDDELIDGWLDHLVDPDPAVGVVRMGAELVARGTTSCVRPQTGAAPDYPYGTPLAGSWSVRRDLFSRAGAYDEHLRHSENTELLIRILTTVRHEGLRCRLGDHPVLRSYRDGGPAKYFLAAGEAAKAILTAHGPTFEADPALRAHYEAIVSVRYRRAGDRLGAVRWAVRSWRSHPMSWRNGLRVPLSLAGPTPRLPL